MANQVTGVAQIQIDGDVIRSIPGATLMLDSPNRDPIFAGGEFLYKEDPQPPELECTIAHTADQSIRELADIVDALVIFTTDSGVVFHLRGAFTMEPPKLDSGSGEISLKMSGSSVDEQ